MLWGQLVAQLAITAQGHLGDANTSTILPSSDDIYAERHEKYLTAISARRDTLVKVENEKKEKEEKEATQRRVEAADKAERDKAVADKAREAERVAREAEAKAAEGEERVRQQAAERAKQREDDLREAAEAETEAERLRQRVAIDEGGAVITPHPALFYIGNPYG